MYKLTSFAPENDKNFHQDTDYIDWDLMPQGKFHVNYLPKPFCEIQKEEFESQMDTYSPIYQGIGQIHNESDYNTITGTTSWKPGYFLSARYYFFENTAFADIKVFDPKLGAIHKYYRIGCFHVWERIGGDKFEYRCKCKKCGRLASFQTGY